MSKPDSGQYELGNSASGEALREPERPAVKSKRALLVGVAVASLTVTLVWLSLLFLALKGIFALF
jgi:cobalamin biosynthesis protein CbiG